MRADHPGSCAQVHHDLKANRFIQAWAAFGSAGWQLEGECEPDVSFGLGSLTILGDNWLNTVTFRDGEQFTWNKARRLQLTACSGRILQMLHTCSCCAWQVAGAALASQPRRAAC